MSLALLQQRLFALITAPDGVRPGLTALGLGAHDLEAMVAGDERASAIERLDVYANMYFFRIRDVLREYFPKLAAVVGDDAFHDLVTAYLIAHPSTHPSLRYVGRALPAFVAGHALARERPWLGELAALEWARLDVFDRADTPPLTRAALAALPPEAFAELPLCAIPALELVPARHAVEETWRSLAPPPLAAPGHTLMVWRRDVTVYHRPLDDDERATLPLVRAGTGFGELCARLGEDRDDPAEAAQAAAGLLARWLADDLLAGLL